VARGVGMQHDLGAESIIVRQRCVFRLVVRRTDNRRAFCGSIEGCSHTPGMRNVLRINRNERKQVPADASRYIHMLDLVVETEVVKQWRRRRQAACPVSGHWRAAGPCRRPRRRVAAGRA